MRIQYLLCISLLLCGCTKVSDLTHQKSKSTEKAPVTVKKTNKVKVIDCKNDSSQQVTFEAKGDKIQKMTQKLSLVKSALMKPFNISHKKNQAYCILVILAVLGAKKLSLF